MPRGADRGDALVLEVDPRGFMWGRQALILRIGVRVVVRPICLLKPILAWITA